jgi:Arc/MetJ-type ribon-helix-helix transcriptional regulator
MRWTGHFRINLLSKMADAVRAKVAAGECATESQVTRHGLHAPLSRDRAVEFWFCRDVAAALAALKADPSTAIDIAEVKARLANRHQRTPATTTG